MQRYKMDSQMDGKDTFRATAPFFDKGNEVEELKNLLLPLPGQL